MARSYKTPQLVVPSAEKRKEDDDGNLLTYEVYKITGSIRYHPGQILTREEVEILLDEREVVGKDDKGNDLEQLVWTISLIG